MLDWTTTAFVFPGQGSQHAGMGADLAAAYPAAREVFQQADEILGFSLSTLCFEGPEEELNDTLNTQPALYVMGAAILRVLEAELGSVRPAMVAGHSLGELTALHAAGALEFADGLRLVRERGRLMKEAGVRSPGAMAAILGLDADAVRALCADVISGGRAAGEAAVPLATERGAKRAIPLAVSVASHSPLMASITGEFRDALDATTFSEPVIPVIGNVHAAPLTRIEAIRTELAEQLTSTVRWTESVQYMRQTGIETFVEIGPKDVLSGLIKRIDRAAERITLNSAEAVQSFLDTQR